MILVVSFTLGMLFGLGLIIAGMVNPHKVIGFLDFAGEWDPSLIFVMGGGVILNVVLFKFILKRPHPLFSSQFNLPTANQIDFQLVVGSALFGIGWGIAGICPGPAISNFITLDPKIFAFLAAMLIGMKSFDFIKSKLT